MKDNLKKQRKTKKLKKNLPRKSRSSNASLFTTDIRVSWEKQVGIFFARRGNNRFPSTTVAKQQKRTLLIDGFRWKRFGVRKTECHEQTE